MPVINGIVLEVPHLPNCHRGDGAEARDILVPAGTKGGRAAGKNRERRTQRAGGEEQRAENRASRGQRAGQSAVCEMRRLRQRLSDGFHLTQLEVGKCMDAEDTS